MKSIVQVLFLTLSLNLYAQSDLGSSYFGDAKDCHVNGGQLIWSLAYNAYSQNKLSSEDIQWMRENLRGAVLQAHNAGFSCTSSSGNQTVANILLISFRTKSQISDSLKELLIQNMPIILKEAGSPN